MPHRGIYLFLGTHLLWRSSSWPIHRSVVYPDNDALQSETNKLKWVINIVIDILLVCSVIKLFWWYTKCFANIHLIALHCNKIPPHCCVLKYEQCFLKSESFRIILRIRTTRLGREIHKPPIICNLSTCVSNLAVEMEISLTNHDCSRGFTEKVELL